MSYSILQYGQMVGDRTRVDGYLEALRNAIQPGSVVLDIGTGIGIFAVLACRLGARKVYAIEPSDAISLARNIADANGFGENIEFVQDVSTNVTLPERADVIVSDIRGILPYCGRHIPAIIDARERFLASGGVLIPQRDSLWAALVEAPELYRQHVTPWGDHYYDFDFGAGREVLVNGWYAARFTPEQILAAPQRFQTLNYQTIESPNCSSVVMNWTPARGGVVHGLAVWFDSTLGKETGFSNAPDQPELVYRSGFFPLVEPVSVGVDDQVSVRLDAHLVGEEYVWRWGTRIEAGGLVKADFRQSTFFGECISQESLRRRGAEHTPVLNEDGRIDRFILERMGSGASLRDIASEVSTHFPSRFDDWRRALARVGSLSEKYSQS